MIQSFRLVVVLVIAIALGFCILGIKACIDDQPKTTAVELPYKYPAAELRVGKVFKPCEKMKFYGETQTEIRYKVHSDEQHCGCDPWFIVTVTKNSNTGYGVITEIEQEQRRK